MRILPALLVLALFAPLGAGQPVFDQDTVVRVAHGDIPTTDAVEAEGAWNVEYQIQANGTVRVLVPAGASLARASCDGAPCQTETEDGHVTLTTNATEVRIAFSGAPRDGAAFVVPPGSAVIVYAPADVEMHAAVPLQNVAGDDLWYTTDASGAFWYNAVAPVPLEQDGFPYLIAAAALVAGAALWAFLVHRGIVQKRTRKQVAGAAAHTAYANESKDLLEARKRNLMAAMKDLEVAKMDGRLGTPEYDVLKAELKKETVTVMRALEGRAEALK